jgi:hypothetical protein
MGQVIYCRGRVVKRHAFVQGTKREAPRSASISPGQVLRLSSDQTLCQPAPLFIRLDESVIEGEFARMGRSPPGGFGASEPGQLLRLFRVAEILWDAAVSALYSLISTWLSAILIHGKAPCLDVGGVTRRSVHGALASCSQRKATRPVAQRAGGAVDASQHDEPGGSAPLPEARAGRTPGGATHRFKSS